MADESAFTEALAWVASAIGALSLTGVTVVNEDMPQKTDRSLPYISVCPAPQPEATPQGTNQTDKWVYPVQVAIVASKEATTRARVFAWRQAIKRRFSNQTPPANAFTQGVANTVTCSPQVPLDPNALLTHKLYVSVLLVRVEIRENRS